MEEAIPNSSWRRILLTGAAGEIGCAIRPALRGTAGRVRLLDRRSIKDTTEDEEAVQGDIADPSVAEAATREVDCLIHLAGIPRETGGTPEEILHTNVVGCHTLFEAARRNGTRRIIFASSNHVIGFYRAGLPVGTEEPVRPDGYYGVSKVFGEALGRLYADKYGMDVACLRIGAFRARPGNARELAAWISHRDMAQLARRCVMARSFGFLTLYGVSGNRRALWGGDAAARALIGYVPQDDAEAYAAELEGVATPGGGVAALFHGGSVCALDFRGDPERVT
ncbi:NAD(P)-dependent oxidoreductase [Roseomonas sp. SSH11]|uniref:NAD(P)-dependent oxidoreductase n=1 Tax=Pararoseomonas baculiformis TaxID=2820812 RepID=A0ABS4ADL3_9PROT|nr:NAD(P)-dependent oxidoreductase [Pararoseomonas baculiformis]MBP0445092.1 NAD(P)-dependent oxidoreductase [Pararoseomonas baculiformis]